MSRVARIRGKGACRPAVRSKRKPRDGVRRGAQESKGQHDPKQVKLAQSASQRRSPIRSFDRNEVEASSAKDADGPRFIESHIERSLLDSPTAVLLPSIFRIQSPNRSVSKVISTKGLTGNQTQSALPLRLPACFYFLRAFFTAVRGTALTAVSSTTVLLAAGLVAPAGTRLVVTVWASSVPVYTMMREASIPLSVTR